MISEYHINKLLEKLKEVIDNQTEILHELRELHGLHRPPVAKELPKENWAEPEEKSESPAPEKQREPIEILRLRYQNYKESGGMLKWNEWRKSGRPKTALEKKNGKG